MVIDCRVIYNQNNMKFNLSQIFKKKQPKLNKDQVAAILSTNREALESFERSYQINALSTQENDFFQINSRQASADVRTIEDEALAD